VTNIEQRLKTELSGAFVDNFKFTATGWLILYLDPVPELVPFPVRMWISSPWRLRAGGRVVVGLYDPPEIVLREFNLLRQKTIREVQIVPKAKDLRINFSGESILETFTNSFMKNLEHWEYRSPDGYRLGLGNDFLIL
jgi:hypothetical protein